MLIVQKLVSGLYDQVTWCVSMERCAVRWLMGLEVPQCSMLSVMTWPKQD